MINWKEISGLHVISRLEKIISSWFGVEIFYTDEHYRIQSKLFDKDFESSNYFLNIQLSMPHGHEFLNQDIEKVTDMLQESDETTVIYESCFPGVKGVASKVVIDGEYSGTVFAFPYLPHSVTEAQCSELVSFLTKQGVSEEEASKSVTELKRMYPREKSSLKDLMIFVAEEIGTFHEEIQKREDRIQELNSELGNKYRYHNLIGKAKKMQQIYRLLEKISTSESSILIQGENGTGKELVAKAIHYNSPREKSVFLAVNCSAFNDNLLDSELFGHVKGAFTGAIKDKKGLFEQANGGTLFLDEIGDTSLTMQVKLLRVLQEGTFLPVGATNPKKVDVRIIAATNKPLKEMIGKGEFREDLYYRINVLNVHLPPMRDRKDDIPLLIEHFLEKRCAEAGIPTKTISKKTMEKLYDYHFPGNVRELENEIERLVVLAGDEKNITPDYLSPKVLESQGGGTPQFSHGVNTNGNLKEALEQVEYMMIKAGLKRCNFNKSKLAKELGISRAGLIMKVDKYGLDKRKKAAGE